METKNLLYIMIGMFLISLVSASTLGTYKKDDCINLHQVCDNCTYVNLTTVLLPNSTIYTYNREMTKTGEDYNFTFCNTSDIGDYLYNTCGDKDGSVVCENIEFKVNAIGFESTDARSSATNRGIYLILIIAALFFIGFIFVDKTVFKWSMFLLFVLFLMMGVNMTFITLYNEIGDTSIGAVYDRFAAFSSYMFWFTFGLLLAIWVLSTLATLSDRRRMNQARAVGEPVDFNKM